MTRCEVAPLPAEFDCIAVVPVYNGARTIGQCVSALLQSRLLSGVIVVDDGSTDESAAIARDGGAEVISSETNRGPSAARNTGLALTDAQVVILCDADVIVDAETVAELIRDLQTTSACVVTCAPTGVSTGRWIDRYKATYMRTVFASLSPDVDLLHGSLCAVRPDCVPRFDESLRLCEDVDIGRRMARSGHRIHLAKGARWRHLHQYSVTSLLRNDYLVPRALAKIVLADLHRGLRMRQDRHSQRRPSPPRVGHTSGRQLLMLGAVLVGLASSVLLITDYVQVGATAALIALALFYTSGARFVSVYRAEFGRFGGAAAAALLLIDHHVMLAGALCGAVEGVIELAFDRGPANVRGERG